MAKPKPFAVTCPCCQAELTVDPVIQEVLTFKAAEKPREIGDIETAMQMFKGEAVRREDAFQKSVAAEKNKANVLDRKFDELLRKAKENPDEPPEKGIEWD
jgi:pyocin large subunit-like protein